MSKFMKVVAALMLSVVVVCAAGCKKEPNGNNDDGVIIPEGAVDGVYSVSATNKVCFSRGNLQYQASTNTWRFAEKQYCLIGENNNNINSTYSGWIDLFGWGTSGFNNKYPYLTSTSCVDYGNGEYDIACTKYDWGVYNRISNGGNQIGLWRTMTIAEWMFLFNGRNTSSGISFAKAQVNGVDGVILVPDDWDDTTFYLNNTNDGEAGFTSNVVSEIEWQNVLEVAGAVFLPAAGGRTGTVVHDDVGPYGCYWSTKYYGKYGAYGLWFDDWYLDTFSSTGRCNGFSVRLVCPAD